RARYDCGRVSSPMDVGHWMSSSDGSAQSEEGQDGHDHHDQADEIDDAVHRFLPWVRRAPHPMANQRHKWTASSLASALLSRPMPADPLAEQPTSGDCREAQTCSALAS